MGDSCSYSRPFFWAVNAPQPGQVPLGIGERASESATFDEKAVPPWIRGTSGAFGT